MLDFVISNNVLIIAGCGVLFALVGAGVRYRRGVEGEDSKLVFADGFQGATIATLVFVAVMVICIDDAKAVAALKEQANTVVLFSLLGSINFFLQFVRSLQA